MRRRPRDDGDEGSETGGSTGLGRVGASLRDAVRRRIEGGSILRGGLSDGVSRAASTGARRVCFAEELSTVRELQGVGDARGRDTSYATPATPHAISGTKRRGTFTMEAGGVRSGGASRVRSALVARAAAVALDPELGRGHAAGLVLPSASAEVDVGLPVHTRTGEDAVSLRRREVGETRLWPALHDAAMALLPDDGHGSSTLRADAPVFCPGTARLDGDCPVCDDGDGGGGGGGDDGGETCIHPCARQAVGRAFGFAAVSLQSHTAHRTLHCSIGNIASPCSTS